MDLDWRKVMALYDAWEPATVKAAVNTSLEVVQKTLNDAGFQVGYDDRAERLAAAIYYYLVESNDRLIPFPTSIEKNNKYPNTTIMLLGDETEPWSFDKVRSEFVSTLALTVDEAPSAYHKLDMPVIESNNDGEEIFFKAMSFMGVFDKQFTDFVEHVLRINRVTYTRADERRITYFPYTGIS